MHTHAFPAAWTKLQSCDEFVGPSRSKHSACVIGDGILVFGGDDGHVMLNDVLRFDAREQSWSRVAAKGATPSPRYHHSAVMFGSSMFVFGGYTGDIDSNSNLENRNDIFVLQIDRNIWREVAVVEGSRKPAPRSAHVAAVFQDYMYIFGGFDGQERLQDMWRLPLSRAPAEWELVAQHGAVPPPTCNSPGAVAAGALFLFSGHSGKDAPNGLFRFDFATAQWARMPSAPALYGGVALPTRRFGHAMVHHAGVLLVFGGASDSTLTNALYRYDVARCRWDAEHAAEGSPAPSGRCFHSASVVADAMFVFGGTVEFSHNTRSNQMFRFQMATLPASTLEADFLALLESGHFSNVAFSVAGERIAAHAAVVAARSPVLRATILEQAAQLPDMEPIPIDACSAAAFCVVLKFMYSDRLEKQLTQETLGEAQLQQLLEVYGLAVRFELPKLVQQCKYCFQTSISISACLLALTINLPAHDPLREQFIAFCVKDANYRKVVASELFEKLPATVLIDLVRSRERLALVHASRDYMPSPTPEDMEQPSGDLQSDMLALLGSAAGAALSDLTLLCTNGRVSAHRAVLAARCQYFRALLAADMQEARDGVASAAVAGASLSTGAATALLRFVYADEAHIAAEHALALLHAPAYFGMANLRLLALCKRQLELSPSHRNVFELLEAADALGADELKAQLLAVVAQHFGDLARLPRLQLLRRELLLDVLAAVAAMLRAQSAV